MHPDHFGQQDVQHRVREGAGGPAAGEPVGLEIGGQGYDGYAEGGRVADFHADAVVQAGPVQQREHPVDAVQPFAVEFVQAPALASVRQVFLVGIAERQEHRIRADAAGEALAT